MKCIRFIFASALLLSSQMMAMDDRAAQKQPTDEQAQDWYSTLAGSAYAVYSTSTDLLNYAIEAKGKSDRATESRDSTSVLAKKFVGVIYDEVEYNKTEKLYEKMLDTGLANLVEAEDLTAVSKRIMHAIYYAGVLSKPTENPGSTLDVINRFLKLNEKILPDYALIPLKAKREEIINLIK